MFGPKGQFHSVGKLTIYTICKLTVRRGTNFGGEISLSITCKHIQVTLVEYLSLRNKDMTLYTQEGRDTQGFG